MKLNKRPYMYAVLSIVIVLQLFGAQFDPYPNIAQASGPEPSPQGVQATLYASPDGNGTKCTVDEPCSLYGARDKVRTINADMTGDIVVYLSDGTYALPSTFELEENNAIRDSGTNGYDVIYTAVPGANPVISGGMLVTGWELHDPDKEIYRASVDRNIQTRQFYVNGVRAKRAASTKQFVDELMGTFSKTDQSVKTNTGYTVKGDVLQTWHNPDDIEFVYTGEYGHGWGVWKWSEPRCGVADIRSLTSGDTEVTMKTPCWDYAKKGIEYGMGEVSKPTRTEFVL